VVIVTGRDHIEELRSAPEEILSFHESANEASLSELTVGNAGVLSLCLDFGGRLYDGSRNAL
jgi:hypothetical protein